jgi:hypothetical protein
VGQVLSRISVTVCYVTRRANYPLIVKVTYSTTLVRQCVGVCVNDDVAGSGCQVRLRAIRKQEFFDLCDRLWSFQGHSPLWNVPNCINISVTDDDPTLVFQ